MHHIFDSTSWDLESIRVSLLYALSGMFAYAARGEQMPTKSDSLWLSQSNTVDSKSTARDSKVVREFCLSQGHTTNLNTCQGDAFQWILWFQEFRNQN